MELYDLYQADLVEMIPHAKVNKGYKCLMTVINAFSKFAYAVPLKPKMGAEVARALEPIVKTNRMKYLQTANGKEYYNSDVQSLLDKYKVKLYSTFSENDRESFQQNVDDPHVSRVQRTRTLPLVEHVARAGESVQRQRAQNDRYETCLLYTSRCV